MKRKICLLPVFIMVFSLAACGGTGSGSQGAGGASGGGAFVGASERSVSDAGSSSSEGATSNVARGIFGTSRKSPAELGWKEVAEFDVGFYLPPVDGIKRKERYVANGDGPLFQVSYYFETGNYKEDFSADGVPQNNVVSIRSSEYELEGFVVTKDNIGIDGPGILSKFKKNDTSSYKLYAETDDYCLYQVTGGAMGEKQRQFLLFHTGDTAYYTITTSNSAFDAGYFTEETYGMFIDSIRYLRWKKEAAAPALPGWKMAYLMQLDSSVLKWTGQAHVGVEDVNSDGVPEVWYNGSSPEQRLFYLDYSGTLRYIDYAFRGFSGNENVIYVMGGRQGWIGETVYALNKDTGVYEPIFNGSYYQGDDASYRIQRVPSGDLNGSTNGDPVSKGDYGEMLKNAIGADPEAMFSGGRSGKVVEKQGVEDIKEVFTLIKNY